MMGVSKVPGPWSQQFTSQFNHAQKQELRKDLRKHFDIGKKNANERVLTDNAEKAFETFAANQASLPQLLAQAKANDKPLNTLLTEAQSDPGKKGKADEIQQQIQAAFSPSKAFIKEKEGYTNAVKNFNQAMQERTLDVFDLLEGMDAVRNDALNALNAQHEADKKGLETLFATDAFKKNLEDTLQLTPAQISSMKETMLTQLKDNHSKQKEQFDNTSKQALIDLHKESSKELRTLLFYANLRKHNKTMNKLLNEMAEDLNSKAAAPSAARLQMGAAEATLHPDHISLRGLDFSTIKSISTLTGRKIVQVPDQPGVYRAECKGWTEYLLDFRNKSKAMLINIAEAVKAGGYETLTLNVDCDEKKADQLAAIALEAAVEAGFALEDITIVVNGKTRELKELPNYAEMKTKAEKVTKEFESMTKPSQNRESMKQILKKGRDDDATNAQANQTQATTPKIKP